MLQLDGKLIKTWNDISPNNSKHASSFSPFSFSSASEEEEEDCGKDCSLFWAQASSLAQEVGADLGRVVYMYNSNFLNFSILVIWEGGFYVSF